MYGRYSQMGGLMKTIRIVAAACLLGLGNVAHAVDWSGASQAELALLPPYCEAKMNEGSPNRSYWSRSLGPIFQSIHHYCAGLNFMNRYYRSTASDRGSLLSFAIDNFNYMLKDPSQRGGLIPEIYVQRGMAHKLRNNDSQAISDFYKAIELNPRFGRAYLELINYFTEKGQRAKALEVTTQSLRYLPDARLLQKRYDELGGSQPYPEPIKSDTADIETETDTTAEPAGVTSSPEPDPHPETDESGDDEFLEKPIGTKKNPWCRFCTE